MRLSLKRVVASLVVILVGAVAAFWIGTGGVPSLGPAGDGEDDETAAEGGAPGSSAPMFEPRVARAERERERFVPGRLIVRFRADVSEGEKRRVRRDVGASLVRELPLPGTELVSFSDRRDVNEVRRAFDEHPETAYSEPDLIYDISATVVPEDPGFSSLWGLHNSSNTDIDAPETWALTTGSPGITVGVVDTGVAWDHPDLASNIWANPGESGGGREANGRDDDGNGFVDDFRGWDWVDRDNDPYDAHGHGTHVAGTVGAIGNNDIGVTGVNWKVGLVPLRVLNERGSGTTSAIAAAFSYAGAMGLDVVNASLGGPSYSQTMYDAIRQSPNTLFVAAAGNDVSDNDTSGSYPCNYPAANLVCVAAVTKNDTLAFFSNYGATTVHLGAPGEGILSTLPRNEATGSEYGRYSGTSMAAPHVAGAAALIRAARSGLDPPAVREALLSGVVPMAALQETTVSGGRLNVRLALQAAGATVPPPSPTPVASLTPAPSPAPTVGLEEVPEPTPPSSPTPTPDESEPTPSPSPTAARSVTLRLVRHVVVKVNVASDENHEGCAAGTRVVIRRNGVRVARGTTGATGRFERRLKDRTGRYSVVVPATPTCARATAAARHRHGATASRETDPTEDEVLALGCWEPKPAERRMRRLHNRARIEASIGRLRLDPDVSKLARSHSREMLRSGAIFHSSSTALADGVTGWSLLGENVGVGATPDSLQAAFMASEPHRRNILRAPFTHVGVGTTRGNGRLWITVIFKAAIDPKLPPRTPIC